MADKVITINDSQERVDFWSEEISHFFNWNTSYWRNIEKNFQNLKKNSERESKFQNINLLLLDTDLVQSE